MTERARAGVKVRLTLDTIGGFATWDSYFTELRSAGASICWYHPFRWHILTHFNNRTYREIIVIDGRIAFIGGAGIADHWYKGKGKNPRWRDAMFRTQGEPVQSINGLLIHPNKTEIVYKSHSFS